MRPPANPGLIRSKSVANLSTPAGRPMRDVTSRVVSRGNVQAAGTGRLARCTLPLPP